jgi:hypothetical protein
MRPHHFSMARMMVAEGLTPGELARKAGMTPSQVSIIINSPLFIAERQRLESQAEWEAINSRTELEIRKFRAIQIIDEVLECDSLKMKRDMALEILDRTDYEKKPEVQKHLHLHAHKQVKEMSDEELERETFGALEEELVDDGR